MTHSPPRFALLLALAAGCTPAPRPQVPIPPADLQSVADGNNAFTLALYQKVGAAKPGNVILSPFSVRAALGMLEAGARGETAESLRKLLHFDLPEAQLHHALGGMAQNLAASDPYELETANALWPRAGLALKPEFAESAKRDYGAGVEALDYANPEASRKRINGWTGERTRGRIPDLLAPGVLKPDTTLVLTNAVYFKGAWKKQFDAKQTKPGQFTTAAGEVIQVPMMHQSDMPGGAKETEAGTWLRLPYKGDRIAMIIAMPPKGSAPGAMLAGLDAAGLAAAMADLGESKLSIGLPRFQFKTAESLLGPLGEMGFVNADYSGIADEVGIVDVVEHAATVEVNEEGTVAAAATGGIMKASYTLPRVVVVDRPFAFLIVDTQSGAVLFVGHVADPR